MWNRLNPDEGEFVNNKKIADMFREISYILDYEGVKWKPRAYQRAAITLETLDEDVKDIYEREGIEGLINLPGIGRDLAQKIVEFLETGKIEYYEELKKKYPIDFKTITAVPGMGPKKAIRLYKILGIRTLEDLKRAAENHMIKRIRGFGEKSEQEILNGIRMLERFKDRILLGDAYPLVMRLLDGLKSSPYVERVEVVGSFRRMRETVGDIDLLVVSDHPRKVMDLFVKLPGVSGVQVKGEKKTTVYLEIGIDCDLRVFPEESFGSAMLYFTGSKAHNIRLRKIAQDKGYKLNEYGLYERISGKLIASRTEEEIYSVLGLSYIPPEMREDTGEVEAALEGDLPEPIEYSDVRGDTHVHSRWSDGSNEIDEIASACEELGYEYVVITDHWAAGLPVSRGLDEKKYYERKEIIESFGGEIKIIDGVEANILPNGKIDVPERILSELTFVSAGVHSKFEMNKHDMTNRLLRAMDNEYVRVIVHPTGRIIKEREGYEFDLDKVYEKAADRGIAFEVNAYPNRLDLPPYHIRKALEHGVKLIIGTDSHSITQLWHMTLGIGTARRGWARREDVLNTLPYKRLIDWLKK